MICKINGRLENIPSSQIMFVDDDVKVYGGKEKMCAIAERDAEMINRNNKRKALNSQIKMSVSGV